MFNENRVQRSKAQNYKQATMNVCQPSCVYTPHACTQTDRQIESTCASMQTKITKVKTKCGDITNFGKQDYKKCTPIQ